MGRGKRQSQLPLSEHGRSRVLPDLGPAPVAPSNVEVVCDDVPFAKLPNRDDEDFVDELKHLGLAPEETHYRLIKVDAHELKDAMCSIADYITDGDDEGYERASALFEALERGEELPAVVLAYGDDYTRLLHYDGDLGRWVVLDGWHRLCAHNEFESKTLLCYQLLA